MLNFVWLTVGLMGFVALPFLIFGGQLEALFLKNGTAALLSAYGRYAWLVAIGLLTADLVFPIPTAAIIATLGMVYGPVLGGAVAALGSIVAGLTGYALCRYLGRPAALWLNGESGVAAGERIFAAGTGGWLVVLSRWLPVFSEVVACLAGLSRMPFTTFLIALVCGSVPLGFVYASIGHLGVEHPVATILASAILPLVLWLAVRPWLKRTGAAS